MSVAAGGNSAAALTDPVHGDVTATFSPSGSTLTASAAYDPLGNVTATTGTMPALGYQAGYTDPATGMVNMGARWYSPAAAAFTSADTLTTTTGPGEGTPATAGDPAAGGGPTPYGYADNNPLTTTDPTGHFQGPTVEPPPPAFAPRTIVPVGIAAAARAGFRAVARVGGGLWGLLATLPFLLAGDTPQPRPQPQPQSFHLPPQLDRCAGSVGQIAWCGGGSAGTGNTPAPVQGGAGIGFGGSFGGGNPVVVCGQACLQAQLVLRNENIILTKPHEIPAITQAQLDRLRKAKEIARAQVAKQQWNISQAEQRDALARANSGRGNGAPPNPPRLPSSGCFPEMPPPSIGPYSYQQPPSAGPSSWQPGIAEWRDAAEAGDQIIKGLQSSGHQSLQGFPSPQGSGQTFRSPECLPFTGRGEAYLALGRRGQAKADFQRAIEIDPKLISEVGDYLT